MAFSSTFQGTLNKIISFSRNLGCFLAKMNIKLATSNKVNHLVQQVVGHFLIFAVLKKKSIFFLEKVTVFFIKDESKTVASKI